MQSTQHPLLSTGLNELIGTAIVIEIKAVTGCPSNGCHASKKGSTSRPDEVISPALLARVEQGHLFTCLRINA
jgi:hypothetical protein